MRYSFNATTTEKNGLNWRLMTQCSAYECADNNCCFFSAFGVLLHALKFNLIVLAWIFLLLQHHCRKQNTTRRRTTKRRKYNKCQEIVFVPSGSCVWTQWPTVWSVWKTRLSAGVASLCSQGQALLRKSGETTRRAKAPKSMHEAIEERYILLVHSVLS